MQAVEEGAQKHQHTPAYTGQFGWASILGNIRYCQLPVLSIQVERLLAMETK